MDSFISKYHIEQESKPEEKNPIYTLQSFIFCNLALNISLETIDYEAFTNFFDFNYQKYYKLFSVGVKKSEINFIPYLISWNLSKISEVHPEFFSKNKLNYIIQDFLSLINAFENQNGILNTGSYYINTNVLIMNLLVNTIKFYGDKKTEKANTFLSPYNKIILDSLFRNTEKIYSNLVEKNWDEEKTHSLLDLVAFYVRIVNKIIEYSADDFQEIIEEVLVYIVNLYCEIDIKLKEFIIYENENKSKKKELSHLRKSDYLFNYKNHLISINNMIFSKINRIVKDELTEKILNSIINRVVNLNNETNFSSITCIGFIVLSKYF